METAVLNTIKSYEKIAQNPSRRGILLKDESCLSFLVYVLDDKNEEVVKSSLNLLILMTEKVEECGKIKQVCGITQVLSSLIQNPPSKSAQSLAQILWNRIHFTEEQTAPLQQLQNSMENLSFSGKLSDRGPIQTGNPSVTRKRGVRFIGSNTHRSRCLTFQLSPVPLTYEHRQLIEKKLLEIRGVISICFEQERTRCILRTKLEVTPETVASSILETRLFTVEQVIKNDDDSEILIPFDANNDEANKENLDPNTKTEDSAGPEYLNESFGNSPKGCGNASDAKAIAKINHNRKDNGGGGWWGGVTNFVTNSFYW